jgi:curved DNA-binding protein CbpA
VFLLFTEKPTQVCWVGDRSNYSMKNYYKILEIEQNASKQAVKLAYVELAKKMYRQVKDGDENSNAGYNDLKEAFAVLSDDIKRSDFNNRLNNAHFNDESLIHESQVSTSGGKRKATKQCGKEQVLQDAESDLQENQNGDYRSNESTIRNKPLKFFWLKSNAKTAAGIIAAVVVTRMFFIPQKDREENLADISSTALAETYKLSNISNGENENAGRHKKTGTKAIHHNTTPTAKKKEATAKRPLLAEKIKAKPAAEEPLIKPVVEKLLSSEDLKNIIVLVNNTRIKNNITVKGIRVVRTQPANVKNPFDIVPALQAKGYAISGRGSTSENVEGVRVEIVNGQLLLTVGRFETATSIPKEEPLLQEDKQNNQQYNLSTKAALKTIKTPEKVFEAKELSTAEIDDIINLAVAQSASSSNNSNCIAIMQAVESNVSNVNEIITALQANGFFISGRGFVKRNTEGAKLETGSSCLTLIIGKFN